MIKPQINWILIPSSSDQLQKVSGHNGKLSLRKYQTKRVKLYIQRHFSYSMSEQWGLIENSHPLQNAENNYRLIKRYLQHAIRHD